MANLHDIWPREYQRKPEFSRVSPGDIATFLGENDWQAQEAIIYAGNSECCIIEHDAEPGFLVIDGERYYSAAWLDL